jgi:DNA polymerase-3 subunit alpha
MSSNSIDDIINFAVTNKQEYVSLMDINTMYGTMEFYHKATANNLKPIIGLKINYKNENVYLVARNKMGYDNLVRISSFINIGEEYDINKYLDNLFVIVNKSNCL